MKAVRFMRRPFLVHGYRVTRRNMYAVAKWCEGHVVEDEHRPFIRVPVDRPSNRFQTEAAEGVWVILSVPKGTGRKSFKIYTDAWLRENFLEIDDEVFNYEIEGEIPEPGDEEDLDEELEVPENTDRSRVSRPRSVPRPSNAAITPKFKAAS